MNLTSDKCCIRTPPIDQSEISLLPPSAIVDLCCESPGAKSTRGKGTPSHPKGTSFVSEKTHLHLYITIIRLLYISLTPFKSQPEMARKATGARESTPFCAKSCDRVGHVGTVLLVAKGLSRWATQKCHVENIS